MPEFCTPIPGFNKYNRDYFVHRTQTNFFRALDAIEPSAVFVTPEVFTSLELPLMSFVDDRMTFTQYLQFIQQTDIYNTWVSDQAIFWRGYQRLKERTIYPVHIFSPADTNSSMAEQTQESATKQVDKIHHKLEEGPAAVTKLYYGAAVINEFTGQRCQVFLPPFSEDPETRAKQTLEAGQQWLEVLAQQSENPDPIVLNRFIYGDTKEEIVEAAIGPLVFKTFQYSDDVPGIIGQLPPNIGRYHFTSHQVDMPPHPGV